jgi:hypothetical protein
MLPTDDKLRKALPIFTFLVEYFPDVIVELTKLCVQGNIQHNPELAPTDIKWAREKSTDQMNTAFRHMFDRARGLHFDSDGVRHIIKAVWRNMAQAQLDIEAHKAVPYAVSGVTELTEAERNAGLMPDHSPKYCGHGFTVCKVCKFP